MQYIVVSVLNANYAYMKPMHRMSFNDLPNVI
jgi:hypothetical protein